MHLQGQLGNLGEPTISWLHHRTRGPVDQRPWRGRGSVHRSASRKREHNTLEAGQVSGSERKAQRPERGGGQSERSRVPRGGGGNRRPGTWGTEAQGPHGREGDAGQNVLVESTTGETLRSPTVSTTLQRIAVQAAQHPDRVFTTLAHLIDKDFLQEASHRTGKSSAPGIDGVTAQEYAAQLDTNLQDLHERLRSGR